MGVYIWTDVSPQSDKAKRLLRKHGIEYTEMMAFTPEATLTVKWRDGDYTHGMEDLLRRVEEGDDDKG